MEPRTLAAILDTWRICRLYTAHADAIKESRYIIEKYIPDIVAQFYTNLLDYAPTRKLFLKKDGTIDQDYLQLRMHHLGNFWRAPRRESMTTTMLALWTMSGGRTPHMAPIQISTSQNDTLSARSGLFSTASPKLSTRSWNQVDPTLASRASKAWNMLMMVILEMLARAYNDEHGGEADHTPMTINHEAVRQLAVATYERDLGLYRSIEHKDVVVARAADIRRANEKSCRWTVYLLESFTTKATGTRCAIAACIVAARWLPVVWKVTSWPVPGMAISTT